MLYCTYLPTSPIELIVLTSQNTPVHRYSMKAPILTLLLYLSCSPIILGQLCSDSTRMEALLSIEDLGKTYQPHPSKVPGYLMATKSDLGGTTSVRRVDEDNLKWKTQGYYQRNRELGQIFNIPGDTSFVLESIVLRTGNSANAVLEGAPGSPMYIQLFEVIGEPTINDNNTPPGTESTHGFNTNHRTDDYLEGVTYHSIGIFGGGIFPDFQPTNEDGGQPGHLRYMRWNIQEAEVVLQGGKRYAFMVGFEQNGPDRGFSLGNDNQAASGADPQLRVDINGAAWWSMRREGDGTLPPTQVPGDNPPTDDVLRDSLLQESLYEENHPCLLSPTTDGFPDVDTYRAFEFYIEVDNGCPAEGTPCDDGDSTTINDVTDGFCGCFGRVPGGCEGDGTINYSKYNDEFTSTQTVHALKSNGKYPDSPDEEMLLYSFEAPRDNGRRFGARIAGYICPPLSGPYTFYIAGNEQVELNLSTDALPENIVRIAHHEGSTDLREWNKYSSQESRPIMLEAGKFYYIEALMKEEEGDDHLSVAWELPNGTFEGPVNGHHLSSEIECPEAGTPCDDGLDYTVEDKEDGHCGCFGTSTCPESGTPCDDGDPFTENDVEDGNCLCRGALVTSPGLKVSAIGKSYTVDPAKTPDYLFFDLADQGGSTSVRNVDAENLSWKSQGYFQRNRDLGQTFSVPADTTLTLDAIVLRTGNSSSAVKAGAIGAEVYLQIFEVEGAPVINDNGTPPGTESTHGFTTNHRADDYLEGITYHSVLVASGGYFPAIGPTDQDGGQVAHLHYLRWDLEGDNEIQLEGGKRYAFMVGFMEPAPDRRFTLGNNNLAADPAAPELRTNAAGKAWWSMRREGDGTLPPTQIPGEAPPLDANLLDSLISESLFDYAHQYSLSPATDGWPDVDTYRTLEFYIEARDDKSTRVQETEHQAFNVFPNPNRGDFSVSFDSDFSGPGFFEIYDLSGKLLDKQFVLVHTGSNIFPISHYEQGTFILRVVTRGEITNRKIVVW